MIILGPVLAVATYLLLGPLDTGSRGTALRIILMCDLVYVLLIIGLLFQRIMAIIAQRRRKSAGSQLHLRLTGFFTLMSLVPTITVAVFATISINMGFEAWFSDRVQNVIRVSLDAAQAYEFEQTSGLREDAKSLGRRLEQVKAAQRIEDPGAIRQELDRGQQSIQRGLKEAFVITGDGILRLRGFRSYKFDYEMPPPQAFDLAFEDVHLIRDYENNELRALVSLRGFGDQYLYVTREVDGVLLGLLDQTQQTARLYQQLEQDRDLYLFNFGLLYLAFAVLLIVSSALLSLWFAERLSRPIGRLVGAAQRVGDGELETQVLEEEGDDEIAQLSVYFNKMTRQLKGQRDRLLENTAQIEERRRLFDSVLSSVTSGVVGLDAQGRVSFVNRSARRLLGWAVGEHKEHHLEVVVPEFSPLFARLKESGNDSVQDEVKVVRGGRLENLLVRVAPRTSEGGALEGYVIAFDDVTDLVAAQRSAAWGDVARRIAHEIKNPLTPIQLSAERIRRKFSPKLDADGDDLERMTQVIVRQTTDLRRIVDEFSKFARMPEAVKQREDIVAILNQAVTLQQAGQPNVTFHIDIPDQVIPLSLDATMISQALTNLIKNAGEAIATRIEKGVSLDLTPAISISLTDLDTQVSITISDNGIGLPQDRAKLFEPYVTTRDKGTGLGLPIVKKIIEEHGGVLRLDDAEPIGDTQHVGAAATIELPKLQAEDAGRKSKKVHEQ
ncbi:MAG: PAS domain-containing sensor histidine kinase [Rhodobacteraceae bacterium]|jgi:two-component system nitrogen regulation sensor histidine kinase NtrY|nr:PAS domain-containing sensor histidine kinase [Paracoccaceae bacterium]